MTDKYACPNGCTPDVDAPFYAPTCCLPGGYELGVLVYPNLAPTNRWTDGTAGVPREATDWWDDGCMPQCIECHEEIVNIS